MDLPTANDIRAASKLDFAENGYAETSDPNASPDPLDTLVGEAIAYVAATTCRSPLTDVPDELAPLALAAIRMRVEQLVVEGQAESIEDAFEALSGAGIISFSVPGYSETRAQPKVEDVFKRINWWPALADLLWLLMTQECREAFEARVLGYHAPAFAVTEVDWADRLSSTPPDPFDWPSWGWGGDPDFTPDRWE